MKRFLLSLVVLAATFVQAEEPRPSRVDFTSEPVGARVFVNGAARGVTPLTLFDLKPGACHVRYELEAHEPKDQFFNVEEGAYALKHIELVAQKGLLLLTTEPAGCAVMLGDLSLGETPRLITTLDAPGVHRLQLKKAGYQPRTVEVKFKGRTPLAKHEKLILDSGILEVTTVPAGATVMVNGIARGKTPLTVRDIPNGRSKVILKLEGYKDETRELSLNAGDQQKLEVALAAIPAKLMLSSVPEGARFYLDDKVLGKSPLIVDPVAPGTHTVRAELDGYGNQVKSLVIGNGQTVREEFRLTSTQGSLEVRTQPSGVKVTFVSNTKLTGTTRGEDDPKKFSKVLTIRNIPAGEYTVLFSRHGYAETTQRVKIESQRPTLLDVKMKRVFTPNIRIETLTGKHTGVLVNNGPDRIVIETKPGVNRAFMREDIRKIEMLGEGL